MIPTTWFRRAIFGVFVLEVAGVMLWLASRLTPDPQDQAFAQTVAGTVFLLGFYAGGPLVARFMAPLPADEPEMMARIDRALATLSHPRPVFLYRHKDEAANTVGIIAGHSTIYLTTGLMEKVSDEGLRGILAHELAHVREHHILITFTFACTYAYVAYLTPSNRLFIVGFLAFMLLRRYLEYRADAGAARVVGADTMLAGLSDLERMYPTAWWSRFFAFAASHPTMPMRRRALTHGERPLF